MFPLITGTGWYSPSCNVTCKCYFISLITRSVERKYDKNQLHVLQNPGNYMQVFSKSLRSFLTREFQLHLCIMLHFQNTVSNSKTITFADQQVNECVPSFPPEPGKCFRCYDWLEHCRLLFPFLVQLPGLSDSWNKLLT